MTPLKSTFPFRSAPPHGGRRPVDRVRNHLRVSIRAPARGATAPIPELGRRRNCFDPRPRTGGDFNVTVPPRSTVTFRSAPPHGGRPVCGSVTKRSLQFRSAPPHGGRRQGADSASIPKCFDPRPRTGGDVRGQIQRQFQNVSIRAPARGATSSSFGAPQPFAFRSAPPHGGRLHATVTQDEGLMFRSAPPHGGRRPRRSVSKPTISFRSAPPHGGRRP